MLKLWNFVHLAISWSTGRAAWWPKVKRLKDFDKYFTSAIIEPLKIFNWSNTPELYININSNKLTEKFLSGDEKGRIWIYKVKLLSTSVFTDF